MGVTLYDRQSFFMFFILSVLFHMFIIGFLPNFKKAIDERDPFNSAILDSVDVKVLFPGEIVDLPNTDESTEAPTETKYLSDKNRVVEKETKARMATSDPQAGSGSTQTKTESTAAGNEGLSQTGQSQNPSLYPGQDSLSKLSLPYDPNRIDAPLSGETRLNTKTFLYSSFFTRIKRQIAMHWRPEPAFREIQRLNANNPPPLVITRVFIYLNTGGELVNVYVTKSSGYTAWDNEALRSVKAAAPFRNPPIGIFNEFGVIHFEFGFLGELNRSVFERSIE
jgi:TonB family protein